MTAAIYRKYERLLPKAVLEDVKARVEDLKLSDTRLSKVMELLVEEYANLQAEPGESVGLISAESIGEPGTQMSLDYEEKVIVKSQNKVRAVKIGEFIDKIMSKKMNYAKNNDTEICDLGAEGLADIFVPALSQNEKVEWKRVTALSRHKSPESLLKVTTRSGRKITATPYHSFVIRKNNCIVPVAGSSLRIGHRIPSVKRLSNLTNNEFIKLENYLPKTEYVYESELRKAINKHGNFELPIRSYEQINNYVQGNNKLQLKQRCVYPYQNHGAAQIPEVFELDYLFGFFIGAYLAEGTHTEHYIGITNVSEQYQKQVIRFAKRYNVNYRIRHEIGEYGRSVTLLLHSTLIADLMNKTCGRGAYNKHVPDFAYSAKPEFVSGLLQAYFDGDGNINVLRKVIRASSASKELIDGIAVLLSQFGIFASKSAAARNQHTLSISYRYADLFEEKIGLTIPEKREELEKLAAVMSPKTSYDLVDMVPGCGDIFSRLGKKLNVPGRLTGKFTKKQKIGRQTLKKYIGLFENKSKEKNVPMNEELKILKRMLNSDVVWDEITKLEYVNPSGENVYDFSVEDLETFTTFDGIVTHNTLNTFHFAGVAEMNVTMGLPRIIELLDGRKNIATPMMEIYLTEPYNQGKDIKKLALSIKESVLQDIATEFSINIAEGRIEVALDLEKQKELGLTEAQLVKALKTGNKGVTISVKNDLVIFKPRAKEEAPNQIYQLKEKVKLTFIKGVKGVRQVLPIKRENEFIIITAGTNLKKVLALPFVDATRTVSNDVFEIEAVLGIEAAREAIIDEVFKVIQNQGLNVDIRHLMLVADTMCASGNLKGITRYGVVKGKASVLARASFETPIKHFVNASLSGEEDKLESVIENVMLNQVVPVGTGLPQLIAKFKK